MLAILFAIAWLALTFAVHVAWWRVHPPRRQTFAVLLFFVAAVPVGLLVAFFTGFARDLPDLVLIAQFLSAAALAYTCIHSAIQQDSPALLVVTYVALAGPQGCTADDVRGALDGDLTLEPRLAEFERSGMIERRDGRFRLTDRGRRFRHGFELVRRVLGLPRGG